MNPDLWCRAALVLPSNKRGGQELILPEIVASLPAPPARVYLPFPTLNLHTRLLRLGYSVVPGDGKGHPPYPEADAVYFGTPTLIEGRVLFPECVPDPEDWSVARERMTVRVLARAFAGRTIVTGLGSGDVTPEQRMEDLGPGSRVVAFKDFGSFEDRVIVTGPVR